MNFEDYLLKVRRLKEKTAVEYERHQQTFTNWLEVTGREAVAVTYSDLLDFIKHCREKGLKNARINQLLCVVRHYYNYLKHTGKTDFNPAADLYLKGVPRRLPHDLLTAEQLEELYNSYHQRGLAGKRNKIILGLIIYQGLTTGEVQLLEPVHLRLREGRIEVPGSWNSSRRVLKLEAHQMLDLQEYVSKTRELILALTDKETDRLFTSVGESDKLNNSIEVLMRQLRKTHTWFIDARQLRQSRIALWTKQYDIRQVQYLAGHKYVSSTERYQNTDAEELQKELEKCHPLNDRDITQ